MRSNLQRCKNAFDRLASHLGYGPDMFLYQSPNGMVVPAKRLDQGGVSPISNTHYSKGEFADAVEFLERALSGRKVTPVLSPHVGYPLGVSDAEAQLVEAVELLRRLTSIGGHSCEGTGACGACRAEGLLRRDARDFLAKVEGL